MGKRRKNHLQVHVAGISEELFHKKSVFISG
jgi:hypothetical protein